MIELLILPYAIWWALWRRCLGGWLGIRRSILLSVGTLMAILPFNEWGWWSLLAAASVAFWPPGHRTDHWTVWLRYPGPMALGYVLGRKYQHLIPEVKILGTVIIERRGWMAVGELWAGFCFGAILSGVEVLV